MGRQATARRGSSPASIRTGRRWPGGTGSWPTPPTNSSARAALATCRPAAAERALGKAAFEQDVGPFWGVVETRPYMRARLGPAHALWALGEWQGALEHLWDTPRLNPGDNQSVRCLLLNWLLEIGQDARVKKLLDHFPDDAAAVWLYGRALHAFRSEGDTSRARKLRAEAERENSHVPAYLLGRKRLPSTLPETIGFGDDREAIVCAAEQIAAWRKTPGALARLETRARRG